MLDMQAFFTADFLISRSRESTDGIDDGSAVSQCPS